MKELLLGFGVVIVALLIGIGAAGFVLMNQPLPVAEVQVACNSEIDRHNISGRRPMSPEMLKVFREDPLSATDADSYRLIWYPTFDPPTVIRFSRSNGRYAITTKRLSGQGGYELGELEIESTQELSSRDWEEFDALVNRNCFWPAPSAVEELAVLDGAYWIFEANIGGDYHVVGRSLPSAQMAEIFRKLFALSPEKIEFEGYLPETHYEATGNREEQF